MEKIRGKYEIILGFVTLVVSLSAFKDELSRVNLNLGYASISLAQYFLYSVYGFSICLYLYIVEHVVRDLKYGRWKVFDYAIWMAFGLFAFILFTPILLIINIGIVNAYSFISKIPLERIGGLSQIISTILSVITVIISLLYTKRTLSEAKRVFQIKIAEREVKELENANKLFEDGYYSHSILESFKVLETHFNKELSKQGYRIPRNLKMNEIINLAIKEGIIEEVDISLINDLRGMRNAAAHTDTEHTKEHAKLALDFVITLLKRSNDRNISD